MNPEVPPAESRRRGTPMALALEREYARALITLELRRRLAKSRRGQPRPKKRCLICDRVLKNPARTFCSKGCVCAHMTRLAMTPAYYAERAEWRQQQLVIIHCKTCGKDMGQRKPGSVTYCSRSCVGKDPAIRESKSEKRKALWQNPVYRADRAAQAKRQVADPNSRFGPSRPAP